MATEPSSGNTSKIQFVSEDVRYWLPMSTRWSDNDVYGHLNNSWYSHFFDSIINEYLIRYCSLKPASSDEPIGLIVSTSINYIRSVSYPSPVLAALSISRIGRTSVTYKVGLFEARKSSNGSSECGGLVLVYKDASVAGYMTHAFVDPKTKKSTQLPDAIRSGLSRLTLTSSDSKPLAKL